MRFPYKVYPDAAGDKDYVAALDVKISNAGRHSPPSAKFEAIIDSGANRCVFHSQIGRAVGLRIEKGEREETMGVSGKPTTIYIHRIALYVCNEIIQIRAGFTDDLPLAGVLGRKGFFDNFKIIFDPSSTPPEFELERIHMT